MKISAIVVTYNRLQLLKDCLHHLLLQTYPLDNIFVINNNSTDGTKQYLSNINNPQITVINMDKNLGGAGGFSNGLNIAYSKSNADCFWMMDDDTMPSKNALKELVNGSKKISNNFGFLSSNVRWWLDNTATNVPIVSGDWSQMISKSLVKIKEATFVSIFISRKVVSTLGLPIAEEFIWGDDTEFTHRISKNYPCYFVPNSIVFHKSKKTAGTETIYNDGLNRVLFYRFGFRNRLFIDKKYYHCKRFLKDIAKIIIILCKIPFKSNSHRLFRMKCAFIGLINGLTFYPRVKYPNKK